MSDDYMGEKNARMGTTRKLDGQCIMRESYFDATENLTDEEFTMLFRSIAGHRFKNAPPDLTHALKGLYTLITELMEMDFQRQYNNE
jgi:hypothetical protein